MLDYALLNALASVVREGSFERAARALHVTPSAISQRIRLLEERVGCALVIRGQPCLATDTGRKLCQHVDRVQLLENEVRNDLPTLSQDEQTWSNVPIAVNADSLATWFIPAMAAFAASAPAQMQLWVDDESHTTEWLRSGAVMAAVTANEQPASGCSSRPLGAMRYVAAASPEFVARWFAQGVNAASLGSCVSLMFNTKDELQQRWVQQQCGQHVPLPRHTLPSSQGFVSAALAGMGWALHPLALVESHLANGRLVELVPGTSLDVPLYWQQARVTADLLEGLTRAVVRAAGAGLVPV